MSREPAEREARFDGLRTRTLTQGSRGPTLILLHGFSDSADTWRPLMRLLAGAGDHRRVVAVDLPFFGQADRPRTREVIAPLDAFVADLIRSESGRGEPVLVGNSLGGLLALRAAQDPSLGVGAIAAIGPAGLGFQPWVSIVRRTGRALHLLAQAPLPTASVRAGAALVFSRLAVAGGKIEGETLRQYASHMSAGDPARLVGMANRLLAELQARPPVRPDDIHCPTLLIWGSQDRFCPPSGARALPHAQLELLRGRGHCVQLEDPETVARLVSELAARRPRRSRSA